MLVLTRKTGEQIFVGDSITITVVRLGNHTVRIGIEAPGEVLILRAELAEDEDLLDGIATDFVLRERESLEADKNGR